jgi:alpha-L-arabinofuranosidase
VDNLEDVVNKLSRYCNLDKRTLWREIRLDSNKKQRGISLVQSQEDIPIGFEDDKGKEEMEEIESSSSSSSDEEDVIINEQPPRQVPDVSYEMISANSKALNALRKTLKLLDPHNDRDLYSVTKSSMAVYVNRLNQCLEASFSVRDRAAMLGYDITRVSIQQVGKKALEYFRETYPGQKPLQRLITDGDHSYMMNLYTLSTAPNTVDRALREALKKRK